MPSDQLQPLDPRRLKAFRSNKALNSAMIEALLNALKKYNKACKAAADTLEKDFNKIIPVASTVKKPAQVKIKPVAKKPLKKK